MASALVASTLAAAGPPSPWTLPRDRVVCLMEDDLVYARFLLLEQSGAYSQINRDEHGSTEVDRGHWEQDAAAVLRLHSTCRALRPRALLSGPLSITLADDGAFEGLPILLASMRGFLAENRDDVFAAGTMAELNAQRIPAVHVESGTMAVERRDAVALAARIDTALASERTAIYPLEPVKDAARALFVLRGGVFGAADVGGVRQTYRIPGKTAPPFYFARVETKVFAAAVGRWQPLRLPGGVR